MRDLLVFGAMIVFVLFAVRSTFSAYLLWGWSGLIGLNYYLYGVMSFVPYTQVFAIITLAGIVLRLKSYPDSIVNATSVLMAAYLIHGFFSALFAYPGLDRNWELWGNLAKTIVFCFVMPLLVTDRLKLHALIIILAIGVGFHPVLDGLKFIASGGAHNAQSIIKFGDNNHLSLVLVMLVPFLFYLYVHTSWGLVRWCFAVVGLLTVMAILATGSRGGFVGLFIVAVALIMTTKHRWMALAIVFMGTLIVLEVASDKWFDRMSTITSAKEDASFMGRVTAWKVSSAIALDNPVFGGGFRVVQDPAIWDQFKFNPGLLGFVASPQLSFSGVAAHSIWFEVLGDQGFLGLFLFVLLIGRVYIVRRAVWKGVSTLGASVRWAGDLSDAIAISMAAYIVSGSALSAAYFELPYICMMVLECVRIQVKNQVHDTLTPNFTKLNTA